MTSPKEKWTRKISKSQERKRLHDLCRHGKLQQIKQLLRNDSRASQMLNEQAGMFGYTPLHEATCKRCDDVLEQLLLYGGDVNAVSNGYYTPLHLAASNGHVKSIRLLLKYNANIKKKNEFGKTPFEMAELNRRSEAARILKSAEVKLAAAEDFIYIGRLIQDLQCGKDVEKDCFDEALKIAIKKNHQRAAGYLILQGARNVEQCLADALTKPAIFQAATLLLACHAAEIGDKNMLKLLFLNDNELLCGQNPKTILYDQAAKRAYFPSDWNGAMTYEQLFALRAVVGDIDMSFPVSIAVNKRKYDAAKVLLFNKYCDRWRKTVDWHGLALPVILDTWIMEIRSYEKLMISFNDIVVFPSLICSMKHLLRLDISHNHISTIPKALLELPMLRNLNLSQNRLTTLPETEDWTKSMKILNLSSNSIDILPESIAMSGIEDLNLARNELRCIQYCICNLTTLTALDISSNKFITVLPPELGRLIKLNNLVINDMDQINDPPDSLRRPTTSLIRHLRARLRGSEPYFTMKLMFVGFANRGKTTLMHRLNNDFKFNEDQSTKGVLIQDIVIKKGFFAGSEQYTFRCWDFAGQEEYYATHQCFLSQRSIYLIVWRLTDGEAGISALKPWLDNLAARVPKSTVIFVGTHLDVLTAERSIQDIIKEAKTSITNLLESESRYVDNIRVPTNGPDNGIVLVSSNPLCKESQPTIERLRQCIFFAAETMTNKSGVKIMGELIPSSYLSLARLLKVKQQGMQKDGHMPILRRQEFEQLALQNASKNSKELLDEEDLNIATKFLHDIGVILHYDDPNQGLRDLYFIRPSWLCQLMAQVVTVKAGHSFFENGILAISNIPLILGRGNKEFPSEFYAQYLRLLYRFQIACKIDEERILVPSMLINEEPTDVKPNASRRLLRRIHSFTCIPNGFWSRFIGRMLLYMNDMLTVPASLTQTNRKQHENGVFCNVEVINSTSSGVEADETTCEFGRDTPSESDFAGSDCCSPSPTMSESPFEARANTTSPCDSCSSPVAYDEEMKSETILVNNVLLNVQLSDAERSDQGSDVVENGVRDWSPIKINGLSDSNCTTPVSTDDSTRHTPSLEGHARSTVSVSFGSTETTTIVDNNPRDTVPTSDEITDGHNSPTECKENECAYVDSGIGRDWSGTAPSQRINLPERLLEDLPHQGTQASDIRATKRRKKSQIFNDEEFYFEEVDVAELLRTGTLRCWQTGLIFDHPKLYFCTKTVPSNRPGREAIETCVSKSSLGSQVLTFIVDHIRTLVREWYPGLGGTDGQTLYVAQFIPCPICCEFNIHPPHMFDIRECLKASWKQDVICCPNAHTPLTVDLRVICPDLMFQDLPADLLLESSELNYVAHADHVLGEGGFGVAYRGLCGDQRVAIKEYKSQGDDCDLLDSLDVFYDVRQEVVILSKLKRHPFIIDFVGVCLRPHLCAVMQLADQGSLKNAIHTKQLRLERGVVFRIARQVIEALAFMHYNSMIHRDMKPENVLLFSTDILAPVNVKVTDFGTANFVNSTGLQQCTGTVGYNAPEMLEYAKTDEYTAKVDVYAYAILLSELITKRRPYEDLLVTEIDAMVKNGKRPTFGDCPQAFYGFVTLTELMKEAWYPDAQKRPTSKEISSQLHNPLFLFLVGKLALSPEQSPRHLCPVPHHNEVWVMCDSPGGSSIAIINMTTATVKESLKPNIGKHHMMYFNMALMERIDNDHVVLVLRGNNDLLVMYSVVKKRQIACLPLSDGHVVSLAVHEEHVFLGFHSGSFMIASRRDFVKGKLKEITSCVINKHRPIACIAMLKSRLYVANSKYVYMCKSDFADSKSNALGWSCFRAADDIPVSAIMLSPCCSFLYTSGNQGSVITKWDVLETMTPVDRLDCAGPIREQCPAADAIDLRVASFQPVHDTVWAGTGSGHVVIFGVPSNGKSSVLTIFQPYRLEVRSITLHSGIGPDGVQDSIIVTSGKELNVAGMATSAGCLIPLTSRIPRDESARKFSSPRSPSVEVSLTDDSKVILLWQALPSAAMRALLSPYESEASR